MPLLVGGAPEVHASSVHAQENLVQVPDPPRPRLAAPEFRREARPELDRPASDRFVADSDPSLGQELLDITVTQRETIIEPDGVGDHLGGEAMAVEVAGAVVSG